jgi:hypothetical protein
MPETAKTKRKSMSALPTPSPQGRRKNANKEAFRTIARLLEEQMDEMGLSETEKNARTDAFVEDMKRLKAARAATPSK